MQIILLERVENLGQMGDVVTVKDGFARNFLLPQRMALRANDANMKIFENRRSELETRNLERKKEAEAVAEKLDGRQFVVIRQASDMGLLYGSVTTRDIAETASEDGVSIERKQVRLDKPIKTLGIATVRIKLHPEVDAAVEVNVARSEEEAERQARGENVLAQVDEIDEDEAETPEFFDPETGAPVAQDGDAEDAAAQEQPADGPDPEDGQN
ncbi:MAG: 50S ribosomal protein L9 [Pseudomonadota bacterium]